MTLLKFSNGTKPGILNPACQFKSLYDTDSLLPDSLASSVPAVNVSETDNAIYIELPIPGLKKNNF